VLSLKTFCNINKESEEMDFLIIKNKYNQVAMHHSFVTSFKEVEREGVYIKKLGHLDYIISEEPHKTLLEFGDVFDVRSSGTGRKKGTYYTITIKNDFIIVEADPFGYFPVFYAEIKDLLVVSSSFETILSYMESKNEDPVFYQQMAFFFTPIGKTTAVKGISRLEYGSILEIGHEGFKHKKIRLFSDFLTSSPESFKRSIHDVVDCFIANTSYYLEENNAIALTGGYDGRSIVACAHHFNKAIHAFSYGKRGSADVEVPIKIADKLGIDYQFIHLDDEYLKNAYRESVIDYIIKTGGLNGFQYPQSVFHIRVIAQNYSSIVTGYVGSEVIRSPKEPDDEIVSPVIFHFMTGNLDKAKSWITDRMWRLKSIQLLESDYHPNDTLSLVYDLQQSLPAELSANQRLFTYMYENCFMNLFGAWIYNGMHYAKVRIPFLDTDFFDLVSKTKVSAFYLNFPENNMRKRLQSCSFYAYLFDRAWPELGRIPISKGYSPHQLITPLGSLSVALAYVRSRNFKDPNGLDKLGSISGALSYIELLKKNNVFTWDLLDSISETVHGDSYSRSHGFMALSRLETKRRF